jgi:RNA polymerase sigma-70 factor (ECF subfamily)
VLLESLSPVERAVFLLREVFDYEYAEIARIVNREETACRQLFSRARKHIIEHRPRFEPSPQAHEKIVAEFLQAVEAGDMNGLMEMMAEDVAWWSDGGGKVNAARHPIRGRASVVRFLMGLIRLRPEGTTLKTIEVNGMVAILVQIGGQINGIFNIDTDGEHIIAVRAVINPDKLSHVYAE